MIFKKEIIDLLSMHTTANEDMLEIPPNGEMGDYAFPCFMLAKDEKKAPAEVAKELASRIIPNDIVIEIKAIGPYLNFFVNKTELAKKVLRSAVKKGKEYGSSDIGLEHEAMIEHTSTNPNASPHLGRTRNTLIGDSLARLYRFQGFRTEIHYFVNDIGKQIAMLVYGCKGKEDIKYVDMLDVYVNVNNELKEKPELEKDIFKLLKDLESGDKKVIEEFKRVVSICLEGQKALYSELDVEFDYFDWESQFLWDGKTDEILQKLEKTGKIFTDEHGRKVLNLEDYNLPMKQPVMVLTREDGTSLYGLRDLAYNIKKLKRITENNVVVLGEDHKLYHMQVAAALELLGYKAPESIHYSFVLLKEGKMSTRQGTVVLLDEVIEKAKQKAKTEIQKRDSKIAGAELEKLAKIIGYGAVKFAILKISPEKNVTFEWEKALSFEGESAPYIQYAHARINSILKKADVKISDKIKFELYNPEEIALIKKIAFFPEIIKEATLNHKPHLVAVYLQDIAQNFNEFYHKFPVLSEGTQVKKARLLLIKCIAQVIKTGLDLLGIEAPDKM